MRIAIDIDSTLHHYWDIFEPLARERFGVSLPYTEQASFDVFVDDSPANLRGALEAGMRAATLIHPWNEQLCKEGDVVCAHDWPTLRARLEPILREAA